MITYRASLDVPFTTCATVSGWLAAHRRAVDVRPWQRAATCWVQAVLVLRWFKDGTALWLLACDACISQATAYRYLHEALDVIAQHVPDLHEVLAEGREQGWSHVCLDGTLVPTDRSAEKSPDTGYDLWYSGKHKRHGANVQVLTDPTGYPVWVSPAEPGSTHDITAARTHVLPALYRAAAAGLPTLTDKGYTGAGIGTKIPHKGHDLHPDDQTYNHLITDLRAPAERANALLKNTFRALTRISLDPYRTTQIVAAALVLLHLQRGLRTSGGDHGVSPPAARSMRRR